MGMESFKQHLSEYAVLTENTLQQYLPEETEDVVTEAMRYSLLAGGKRLRWHWNFVWRLAAAKRTCFPLPARWKWCTLIR